MMGDGTEPRAPATVLQATLIVCGMVNCDATCDDGGERRLCTRVARAICGALELEDI